MWKPSDGTAEECRIPRAPAVLRAAAAIAIVLAVDPRGLAPGAAPATVPSAPAPIAVCFAPGTSQGYIDEVTARFGSWSKHRFFDAANWTVTATDGVVGGRGTPVTLTWSVVADGTMIPASQFGSAGASTLRKALDGIYGNESVWRPLFEKVFARWGEVAGVRYVLEPNDDGQPIGSASGLLGVRADIRIGGLPLDGAQGVLAYNGLPNDGDMVIDSADAFFKDTSLLSRGFRNVVAHEAGHGLGLDHVCPIRAEKLMEPAASLDFDGPQHDDILGAQRLYGDAREPNDTTLTATDLGAVGSVQTVVEEVSVDGPDDVDLFAFSVPEGSEAEVAVRPTGREYDHALPSAGSGGCGPTWDRVDSRLRADLTLAVLRPEGTQIASADDNGIGKDETLRNVPLDRGAGRYFVRVGSTGRDDVQMYRLEVRVVHVGARPAALADTDTTWEVLPVATPVLGNDTGLADLPLKLRVSHEAESGRVVIAGGRAVYIPVRGFFGQDQYVYEVKDAQGQTSEAPVFITVRRSARAGAARIDTDADGYPDEFEVWRGTAPDDASSLPGESLGAVPATLPVSKVALRLQGRRPSADAALVRGRLPVGPEFLAAGGTVVVSVAGVAREIPLDARGRATGAAAGSFRLHVPRRGGKPVPGDAKFDLTLRNGDFAESWADEGLQTDRRQRNEPRAATLIVLFGGRTYVTTAPIEWSVDKGWRGRSRLAK